MRTSSQLYQAYVAARGRELQIWDECVDKRMSLPEIEKDEAYLEAFAERERIYKRWVNAWKGCGYV